MVAKKTSKAAASKAAGRSKPAASADRAPEKVPGRPRRRSAGKRSEVKDSHDRYAN